MLNALDTSATATDDQAWYADPRRWAVKLPAPDSKWVGMGWKEIADEMRKRGGYPAEFNRGVRPTEAEAISGYKHTQMHKMVRAGAHPPPYLLSDSGRAVCYSLLELVAFSLERLAKREAARLNCENEMNRNSAA